MVPGVKKDSDSEGSILSQDALSFYEQTLPSIRRLEESADALTELVEGARAIIDRLQSSGTNTIPFQFQGMKEIFPADILLAMLVHVKECGGDAGQRYTAAAIIAHHQSSNNCPGGIQPLQALAITWLTQFLFVCKSSRSNRSWQLTDILSSELLRDDLLARDGFQCVVTRKKDASHPTVLAQNEYGYAMRVCQILNKELAQFEDYEQFEQQYRSALTALSILRDFAHLRENTIADLRDRLGGISNMVILHVDASLTFDNFRWCLKRTDEPNTYSIKCFSPGSQVLDAMGLTHGKRIVFRDHRSPSNPCSSEETVREMSLPDHRLIALHSSIAEILNASGTRAFIDLLLARYEGHGKDEASVIRYWCDLEAAVEHEILADNLTKMFTAGLAI